MRPFPLPRIAGNIGYQPHGLGAKCLCHDDYYPTPAEMVAAHKDRS